MNVTDQIKQQIAKEPVLIYIKGTPQEPRCGFSARAVQILERCGVPFHYVDILENPLVRQVLPQVSDWPTFPQLFVNGELIGGSDIMNTHYETGVLQNMLHSVQQTTQANEEIL